LALRRPRLRREALSERFREAGEVVEGQPPVAMDEGPHAEPTGQLGFQGDPAVRETRAVDINPPETGNGEPTDHLTGRLLRGLNLPEVAVPAAHRPVTPAQGPRVEVTPEVLIPLHLVDDRRLRTPAVRQLEHHSAGRERRLDPPDKLIVRLVNRLD